MSKYDDLREKYKVFNYNCFSYSLKDNELSIKYSFEIEGLEIFEPTWTFNIINQAKIDNKHLENLIFNLGMVELVSYWKIACPKQVNIKCGSLDDKQIEFYKKLYFNGLGEFYYINNIKENINDFMDINSLNMIEKLERKEYQHSPSEKSKTLITIGGGKDSIVALNLLKDKVDSYLYCINPSGAKQKTIVKFGNTNKVIIAKRQLDKRMLELNKQGYLNGHTPFSAIVAFSSVLASYINGIEYVALSNECSANEATIIGTNINHQYSKSLEFEKDFNNYENEYLNTGVYYFSFLRPLYEIQIAKLFAKYDDYYSIFKSCNVGSKEDIWCGNCPKCLFVFIILSPFINRKDMINIFNKDLLDDINLKEDFDKLVGFAYEKPFECVGNRDEVNLALKMLINKYSDNLPYLLKYYKEKVNNLSFDESLINHYENENLLLPYFEKILKEVLYV